VLLLAQNLETIVKLNIKIFNLILDLRRLTL
jgi:hypothetical protein